jgi:hypothetical protein
MVYRRSDVEAHLLHRVEVIAPVFGRVRSAAPRGAQVVLANSPV